MLIGIDPGLTGAAVLIDGDGDLVDYCGMATVQIGKRRQLAGPVIANYIQSHWLRDGIKVAYIEQVHSMPKQGVSSAFTFGYATGMVTGMCHGWGLRVAAITPQAWLKITGIGTGRGKDAARLWAINRWPAKSGWFDKKKYQGRADAAAIAWAGLQLEKGK